MSHVTLTLGLAALCAFFLYKKWGKAGWALIVVTMVLAAAYGEYYVASFEQPISLFGYTAETHSSGMILLIIVAALIFFAMLQGILHSVETMAAKSEKAPNIPTKLIISLVGVLLIVYVSVYAGSQNYYNTGTPLFSSWLNAGTRLTEPTIETGQKWVSEVKKETDAVISHQEKNTP